MWLQNSCYETPTRLRVILSLTHHIFFSCPPPLFLEQPIVLDSNQNKRQSLSGKNSNNMRILQESVKRLNSSSGSERITTTTTLTGTTGEGRNSIHSYIFSDVAKQQFITGNASDSSRRKSSSKSSYFEPTESPNHVMAPSYSSSFSPSPSSTRNISRMRNNRTKEIISSSPTSTFSPFFPLKMTIANRPHDGNDEDILTFRGFNISSLDPPLDVERKSQNQLKGGDEMRNSSARSGGGLRIPVPGLPSNTESFSGSTTPATLLSKFSSTLLSTRRGSTSISTITSSQTKNQIHEMKERILEADQITSSDGIKEYHEHSSPPLFLKSSSTSSSLANTSVYRDETISDRFYLKDSLDSPHLPPNDISLPHDDSSSTQVKLNPDLTENDSSVRFPQSILSSVSIRKEEPSSDDHEILMIKTSHNDHPENSDVQQMNHEHLKREETRVSSASSPAITEEKEGSKLHLMILPFLTIIASGCLVSSFILLSTKSYMPQLPTLSCVSSDHMRSCLRSISARISHRIYRISPSRFIRYFSSTSAPDSSEMRLITTLDDVEDGLHP